MKNSETIMRVSKLGWFFLYFASILVPILIGRVANLNFEPVILASAVLFAAVLCSHVFSLETNDAILQKKLFYWYAGLIGIGVITAVVAGNSRFAEGTFILISISVALAGILFAYAARVLQAYKLLGAPTAKPVLGYVLLIVAACAAFIGSVLAGNDGEGWGLIGFFLFYAFIGLPSFLLYLLLSNMGKKTESNAARSLSVIIPAIASVLIVALLLISLIEAFL